MAITQSIDPVRRANWLERGTVIESALDNSVTIVASTEWKRDYIDQHLRDDLERAWGAPVGVAMANAAPAEARGER